MDKMEKKIEEMMDRMNVEETEILLADQACRGIAQERPESGAAERIKRSVYKRADVEMAQNADSKTPGPADQEKAGLLNTETIALATGEDSEESVAEIRSVKQKTKSAKRWRILAACAAVFAVCIIGLSTVGAGDVAAAIRNALGLVPGYGIIDAEEDPIRYVITETASDENASGRLDLLNAVAAADSVSVVFQVERTNITEEELLRQKEEEWIRMQGGDYAGSDPQIYLYAGTRGPIGVESYASAGGTLSETGYCIFYLDTELIDTTVVYRLELAEYGLSVEFTLKEYETFGSLTEIGATDYHNNISITAVPQITDGEATVELYPINSSRFDIYSFMEENETGVNGEKLHLKTNNGIREYIRPDSYGDGHRTFRFSLEPGDTDLSLHIPFIVVQTREEAMLKVKVPEPGEVIGMHEETPFADSTLIVTSAELVEAEDGSDVDHLKLTLDYDNHQENLKMIRTMFMRQNFWGRSSGIGYSYEMDEDGTMRTVYVALDEGEKTGDTLRLRLSNPIYYLVDAYDLQLYQNSPVYQNP